jgi:hypothetical protein
MVGVKPTTDHLIDAKVNEEIILKWTSKEIV